MVLKYIIRIRDSSITIFKYIENKQIYYHDPWSL